MSIPESDNRIQFPPTLIDFDNQVGVTGQFHDNYPAPGQQPRYDWLRCYLLALLSLQSSTEPPTQYRTGTLWYDKDRDVIKIWDGTAWVSISNVIEVSEIATSAASTSPLTLTEWYSQAQEKLLSIQPRVTFSGISSADDVTRIPVPDSVQALISGIASLLRPIVFIRPKREIRVSEECETHTATLLENNSVLVDPRECKFSDGCPNYIELLGSDVLNTGDKFTVIIERFDLFVTETVVA
jgi:hypothetical protein